MGRLGRDVYRKKLERYLSHSFDEPIISLVSALVAAQSGSQNARAMIQDLPPEAVGAELGSPYHIQLCSVETLVNELLAIPQARTEENTSELQSIMRTQTAVFRLHKQT